MTRKNSNILAELRRRNVFRVAIVYVVTSWIGMQIVDVMFPALNLPPWTVTFIAALLIIGFPFALIFAWAFELTPEGLKREREVPRDESITHHTGRKLDFIIIGILAVAVILFAMDKFIWEETATDLAAGSDKSIAVLPFVNMSADSANEYFSDGISEEILNLLAKVPELRVIGRTSSFQFKDKNEDLRVIGETLGVNTILEGSVRKSGDTVRITAQLINAVDGAHLWSDTFDRKLNDIFAVQDEIAGAVTRALRLTLLDDAGIQTEPPASSEAYNLLLKARFHTRRRSASDDEIALRLLEKALQLDPGYAAVWADLAMVHRNIGLRATTPTEIQNETTKARNALNRALQLDPEFAIALSRQAVLQINDWSFREAEASTQRALELAPQDSRILANAGIITNVMGRLDQAIELTEQSRKIDPLNPSAHFNRALYLQKLGRFDEAEAGFKQAIELSPNYPLGRHLAKNYLFQGQFDKALAEYEKLAVDGERLLGRAIVLHAMADESGSELAIQELMELEGDQAAWKFAQIHAYRGDKNLAFEWLEQAYALRDPLLALRLKTEPLLRSLHDDPRWLALIEQVGYPT